MMNTSPFFIVGVPRSGTTLFAVLLNNHSQIYVGKTSRGEALLQVHRRIMETYGLEGDLRSLTAEERILQAVRREKLAWEICEPVSHEARNGLRSLIRAATECAATRHGKVIWGNKSPFMLNQMPQLAHLMPGVRFIHVLRDGRAVAQSQKARRNFHPRLAVHTWKQMILSGRIDGEIVGASRYVEVKYEDLLEEPERVLREICDFLDVDFEPSMLDLERAEATGRRDAYVQKVLDRSKVAAWQERLSREEIEELEAIGGDLLQASGYTLLYHPAGGPFRMLSPLEAILYHQRNHLNDLVQKRRISMVNQQLVEISTPWPERLRIFLRQSVANVLSDRVIEHFRRNRIAIR